MQCLSEGNVSGRITVRFHENIDLIQIFEIILGGKPIRYRKPFLRVLCLRRPTVIICANQLAGWKRRCLSVSPIVRTLHS